MHLMHHLSHHLRKETPFSPHLWKSTCKGSNPIVTLNRRIARLIYMYIQLNTEPDIIKTDSSLQSVQTTEMYFLCDLMKHQICLPTKIFTCECLVKTLPMGP